MWNIFGRVCDHMTIKLVWNHGKRRGWILNNFDAPTDAVFLSCQKRNLNTALLLIYNYSLTSRSVLCLNFVENNNTILHVLFVC
jgi:hypothetical protein